MDKEAFLYQVSCLFIADGLCALTFGAEIKHMAKSNLAQKQSIFSLQ